MPLGAVVAPVPIPQIATFWPSLETSSALIDAIDAALLTLDGVSLPTWGAPHDVTLGNVAHPTSTGTVLMYSEA